MAGSACVFKIGNLICIIGCFLCWRIICNFLAKSPILILGVWCTELIAEPKPKMTSEISAGRPLSGACLQNHVICTFPSRSPIACAFTCKRNSGCKSFNYLINEGRCELNSAGREGSSDGDWVNRMDCVYYQS